MINNSFLWKSKILATSSAAAIAVALSSTVGTVAFAQDQQTTEEITVTGSRIARRDYTANSPIVSVNSQSFESRSSLQLENTLNQLPQFQAGFNSQLGQAGAFQVGATSTPGASFLNLRGLGTNRNLVLIDGRRAQPANASLAIDINTIPAAAIDSAEIITGGASAVYGADAITGVVNFKLKKNFEGLDVDIQHGETEAGDNRDTTLSALFGTSSDRGNIMLGGNWEQRGRALAKDHDFFSAAYYDPNTLSGQNYPFIPYAGYDCGPNSSFMPFGNALVPFANCPSPAGFAAAAALSGFNSADYGSFFRTSWNVDYNGNVFLSTLLPGDTGPPVPGYSGELAPKFKVEPSGALGSENNDLEISSPLDRYSIFGNGRYDITDHITGFFQGMFSKTETTGVFLASPAVQFWGAAVPGDYGVGGTHPVPAALEALLSSRADPTAPWGLHFTFENVTGNRLTRSTNTVFQVVAGLRGDFSSIDWTWEVYGSHGETDSLVYNINGLVSTRRWQAMVSAPNYGENATLSVGSLQSAHCTSGFYGSIFEGTRPSQDCIDAITMKAKSSSLLTQDIAEATIQGGLFDLPAGELRFAAGADYREDSFEFVPDPILQLESTSDTAIGLFPVSGTGGSISVREGYGELLVPVLADLPLVKKLEAELGARYSNYDTSGVSWTYKVLGNWDVSDWLRFRGGYQRAERAANIAELFQPFSPIVVPWPSGDPCSSLSLAPWANNANNTTNRAEVWDLCQELIGKFDPTLIAPGGIADDGSMNTYFGIFPFFFPLAIDQQVGSSALAQVPNYGGTTVAPQFIAPLAPEVAKTTTIGTVIKSPIDNALLSGMQLSVDWYNIKIDGAIVPLTAEVVYEQCFNADGASNPTMTAAGNPFCSLILREKGTGGSRTAINPYFNYGGIETSGIDVQFDWRADLDAFGFDAPGALTLNVVASWLEKYEVQATPNSAAVDYAGTVRGAAIGSQFEYRTYTTLSYILPRGSVGMRWRHFPSADDVASLGNPATSVQGVAAHDEVDLFGFLKLNDTYQLRAGVDNLFDEQPEIAGADTSAAGLNNGKGNTLFEYDALGRRFFVGVKASF